MYCACAATGEGADKSPIPKNEEAKMTAHWLPGMSGRIVFLYAFMRKLSCSSPSNDFVGMQSLSQKFSNRGLVQPLLNSKKQ